jgi:hypothetical protein
VTTCSWTFSRRRGHLAGAGDGSLEGLKALTHIGSGRCVGGQGKTPLALLRAMRQDNRNVVTSDVTTSVPPR